MSRTLVKSRRPTARQRRVVCDETTRNNNYTAINCRAPVVLSCWLIRKYLSLSWERPTIDKFRRLFRFFFFYRVKNRKEVGGGIKKSTGINSDAVSVVRNGCFSDRSRDAANCEASEYILLSREKSYTTPGRKDDDGKTMLLCCREKIKKNRNTSVISIYSETPVPADDASEWRTLWKMPRKTRQQSTRSTGATVSNEYYVVCALNDGHEISVPVFKVYHMILVVERTWGCTSKTTPHPSWTR